MPRQQQGTCGSMCGVPVSRGCLHIAWHSIVFPPDQQSILNDQFYVEETPEEIGLVVMLIYRDRTHST